MVDQLHISSGPGPLSEIELAQFHRDGYLIVRNMVDSEILAAMSAYVDEALSPLMAPVEFEADVQYPGAPAGRNAPGGATPRRLFNAYTRDKLFRNWALSPALTQRAAQLLETKQLVLSQNHHNCIMTKHPGYSSATSWHQDIRYWSFDRPELVNVWLAIGKETVENGCMSILPGSHKLNLDRGRLDSALFLRTDLEENQALLDTEVAALLNPGDVLFFDCKVFHAAGRNCTNTVKKSLVFTYHGADNHPIPDTRSDNAPGIAISLQ